MNAIDRQRKEFICQEKNLDIYEYIERKRKRELGFYFFFSG